MDIIAQFESEQKISDIFLESTFIFRHFNPSFAKDPGRIMEGQDDPQWNEQT